MYTQSDFRGGGVTSIGSKIKGFKSNFAFTLAEVLITIGIIGVVAALTIPNLISNTNSSKFRSQLKKTISTLNQVPRIGLAQYELDYGSVSAKCGSNPSSETQNDRTICGLLNVTLKGAQYVDNPFAQSGYSITSDNDNGVESGATGWHGYQLPDGSMFIFQEYDGNCTESTKCLGYIDVNGYTLPNKEVKGTNSSALNLVTPSVLAIEIDLPDPPPAPCLPGTRNMTSEEAEEYGFSAGTCIPTADCEKGYHLEYTEVDDGMLLFREAKCVPIENDSLFTNDDTITQVPKDAKYMTDGYPVYIYGQAVVPATKAGEIVLKSAK